MSDTPQLLLGHHLKALRLPTFLREYDKLARQCGAEGTDHVRYLVRLAELELIDRERRMIERRIKLAKFPAVKSLDSFDFKAMPFCAPDRIVLDFGCGDGMMLRTLPALQRLAVEVNPVAVRALKAANQKDGPVIELIEATEKVPDDSVDIVMANHSLEHVPHPLNILREFKRVLKAGGTVVVVTPFDDWRGAKGLVWRAGDADNRLYTWTPLNIGNLLAESGLEVVSTSLQTFSWSQRIFWIHRLFGPRAFRLAGGLLSRLKNRREVLAVARKP